MGLHMQSIVVLQHMTVCMFVYTYAACLKDSKEIHTSIGLYLLAVFNVYSPSILFFSLLAVYQWKKRNQVIWSVEFPTVWILLIESLLLLNCIFVPYFGKLVPQS
jgi:hypothetical protein